MPDRNGQYRRLHGQAEPSSKFAPTERIGRPDEPAQVDVNFIAKFNVTFFAANDRRGHPSPRLERPPRQVIVPHGRTLRRRPARTRRQQRQESFVLQIGIDSVGGKRLTGAWIAA